MPEYTLDELESLGFNEHKQRILFGHTIKEMRSANRDGKVHTWCTLEEIARYMKSE